MSVVIKKMSLNEQRTIRGGVDTHPGEPPYPPPPDDISRLEFKQRKP